MNEVSSELGSIRLYSSGPQSSTNQKPQFHCCDLDRELSNFSTEVTFKLDGSDFNKGFPKRGVGYIIEHGIH